VLIRSLKAPQAVSLGLQKPSLLLQQAITILQHLVRAGGREYAQRGAI